MSDPLSETLARLEERIAEARLDRADVLDIRGLSARTSLTEGEIQALLTEGAQPPADDIEDRIRRRVSTLHETRLAANGRTRAEVCKEVASALSISPEWARQLLLGKKMPNVPDLTALAAYFGVEQGTGFFTDPAPIALNRELRRLLEELGGAEEGPLVRFATRHGVVTLALRGRQLTPRGQEALAVMLEGLLSVGEEAER
ncbi:transcriptional regulator [Streptomyces turgidiscabies]|uniref:Transcriptional regulator with XRE-family HTH domain n=1 Tax=Streptomyces turgidiscabies TaxID=85558 RepID=A0ABU0RGS9_9ACTN|nr:transcriptional regulator [Streptomyces turgidiscabies]MDQ0931194.1 transcriptional regulator with XRE-family HTH domain [Streptomyces turgidiscabies]